MISRTTNPAVRRYNSVVIGIAVYRTMGLSLHNNVYKKLDVIGEATSDIGILTDDKRRIFFDHNHAEMVVNNIRCADLKHQILPIKALEVKEYIDSIENPAKCLTTSDTFVSDINRIIDYLTKHSNPEEDEDNETTPSTGTSIEEPEVPYSTKLKNIAEILRTSKLSTQLMNHLFAYLYVTGCNRIDNRSYYEACMSLNMEPGIFLDRMYVKTLIETKRPSIGYVGRCDKMRDLHGLTQIVTDDLVLNLPLTHHIP